MQLYKEWCTRVNNRSGRLLKTEVVDKMPSLVWNPGWTSVYAFSEEDAAVIKANGNSRGWGQYEVWSDIMYIDIDAESPKKADEKLTEYTAVLLKKGIGFDVYTSGNKGYHVVVKHQLVGSKFLPWSQQKQVEAWGFEVDNSIYRHSGLIALNGRVHPKTGKRKFHLYHTPGEAFLLNIVEKKEVVACFTSLSSTPLGIVLMNLQGLVDFPPEVGKRHMEIFKISRDLSGLGMDIGTILGIVKCVNSQWPNPKPDTDIERAVKGALEWQNQMIK